MRFRTWRCQSHVIQHFAGDIPGKVAPVIENTKATSKAVSPFFSMKVKIWMDGWTDKRMDEWIENKLRNKVIWE